MLRMCLLAGTMSLPAFAQDKVVAQRVFMHELTRTILIGIDQFTTEGLDRRFASFVSETDGRFRIARLEVYAGLDDPSGANCKCSFDVTYDFWRVLYRSVDGRLPESAELLVLNGAAAVRTRYPNGEIESHVLRGSNPYSLAVDDTTLQVAHVAITDGPRLLGASSGAMLRFYLTTPSRPTEALARQTMAILRSRTRATNIEVVVRNDPWFIRDMDFPVVTPYQSPLAPPSRMQYEEAAEARCTVSVAISYCSSNDK